MDYRNNITVLRERLLDFSKRNRALYFRPTKKSINLTLLSFRYDKKLVWSQDLAEQINTDQQFYLNDYISFDYNELSSLKYILKLANQNIRDFGLSNLYLITLMLKWKDVTEKDAAFQYSPLLLWPASLTGEQSNTRFAVHLSENEIIINPYIAYQFKSKYNILLPQSINANQLSIDEFLKDFITQVTSANLGVNVFFKDEKEHTSIASEPSTWVIDNVNIRLAIINTQKANILADYEYILKNSHSENLNYLLSDSTLAAPNERQQAEYREVVASDFSQRFAISNSKTNQSYTIQGPPGTGKSQVITNLIAQYIAQGKRVLFVCEKRAALDVVYQRLQELELDIWCNYIHDSQHDRNVFIHQLQDTFSTLEANEISQTIDLEREALVAQIVQIEANFNRYHEVNASVLDYIGIPTYQFLDVRAKGKFAHNQLVDKDLGALPDYGEYLHEKTKYDLAYEALLQLKANNITIDNFENLNLGIITNPDNDLNINDIKQNLSTWTTFSIKYQTIDWSSYRVLDLLGYIDQAQVLYDIFKNYHWSLLKPYAQLTKAFNQELLQIQRAQQEFEAYPLLYNDWITKPSYLESIKYVKTFNQYQNHLLKIVYPSWHEAKTWFSKHYDISKMPNEVKPEDILNEIIEWYEVDNQLKSDERKFLNQYGFESIADANNKIKEARKHIKEHPFVASLIKYKRPSILVSHFIQQKEVLNTLFVNAKILWRDAHELTLAEINSKINEVNTQVAVWPSELNISLDALLPVHPQTLATMAMLAEFDVEISSGIIYKTYQKLQKRHPVFTAYTATLMHQDSALYATLYQRLRTVNKESIKNSKVGQYASLFPDKKTPDYQSIKNGWSILNQEFKKKRKFKSIRTLVSGESGDIIQKIKPIWLMSPLSVAEVFPLETSVFDVVIFDESSQIPLEHSVPAIYRAKQTIVVGDTQQMPPSDFFATHQESETFENTVLSADSLLDIAGQRYENVMLKHHYRSQSELLIRFSNSFFYDDELLTIPDMQQHNQLSINEQYESAVLQRIMQQNISFHYLDHGRFIHRKNDAEALYIADIVYDMLMNGIDYSIGIVAFSIEQQRTIISVLDRLAEHDIIFSERYEAAKNRYEGNLFQGLIIKNLEQIQGDERDIVIISMAYGYDQQQKLKMHFGPINRQGGEKRLNVLLSRARRHMVVVSSIKDTDINSEENAGALMLKRLLTYVAAVDKGAMVKANDVFSIDKKNIHNDDQTKLSFFKEQVGNYLIAKGYDIVYDYGYSDFKISIAIKKPEAAQYNTAILLDDHHFYKTDALSALYFRPKMLKDAGWIVLPIFIKDMIDDTAAFWNNLDQMLDQ